jgi:hypothetical protein
MRLRLSLPAGEAGLKLAFFFWLLANHSLLTSRLSLLISCHYQGGLINAICFCRITNSGMVRAEIGFSLGRKINFQSTSKALERHGYPSLLLILGM